jgi:hypothetical protein
VGKDIVGAVERPSPATTKSRSTLGLSFSLLFDDRQHVDGHPPDLLDVPKVSRHDGDALGARRRMRTLYPPQ